MMTLVGAIRDLIAALIDCAKDPESWKRAFWRCGRIIWVCRAPVGSAVTFAYLLTATAQGRDLFADLGIALWQWLIFFTLLFFWAWVVHAQGRRAVEYDDWVPESQTGQLSYTRRLQLQHEYWYPALWIPRLASLIIFFSVCIATGRTYYNLLPASDGLPEAAEAVSLSKYLLISTVLVALLYARLIWKPRVFGDWIKETRPEEPPEWVRRPPLLAGTAPLFMLRNAKTPHVDRELLDRALAVARGVIFLLLAVEVINPLLVAAWLPRLFSIPILFAGGTIVLGEMAAWSMRWQTPVLLIGALVGLCLIYLTPSFHDARWIETKVERSKAAGGKRQISFGDAVNRWMGANKCGISDVSLCPRPILIAGAGGASRAGFLTATVYGALVDLGLDKERGSSYGDIRSRIFALSTVSGSTAGAAVIRAALLDAAVSNSPNSPPCRTAGTGSWFGQPLMATEKSFDPKKNWRDCFQAILAGDFLSPIIVALTTRDLFPFINPFTGRPAWPDRAAVLEQAFEARYQRFTTDGEKSGPCPDQSSHPSSDGLCRPFGYHPDPREAGAWVPLFFINGTSVFTGRRIIAGDVATTDIYKPSTALMPLAYDLYDIRARKSKGQENRVAVEKGSDIRLSTTATISARFPIISPHGLLRTFDGEVADQIVDGGYFENDGLATVTDVARVLKDGYQLDPIVIRIVNEPSRLEDSVVDPTRPPRPTTAEERSLFDEFFAIGRALVASRSGHEDAYAKLLKEHVLKKESRLYEIGVHEIAAANSKSLAAQKSMSPQTNPVCRRGVKASTKMEFVSMSWWISHPVQAYLDAQLCLPANWQRIDCELREGQTSKGGDC